MMCAFKLAAEGERERVDDGAVQDDKNDAGDGEVKDKCIGVTRKWEIGLKLKCRKT